MPLSRETSLRIRNLLDDGLPPVVRDSRLLMTPLLRFALGRQYREFLDFKARGFEMTPEEFSEFYRRISGSEVHGDTDLNDACADAILQVVAGRRVLEVGAGRGWLAERMVAAGATVTASDIVLSDALLRVSGVETQAAPAERLPWPDGSFEVVVTTHTLEHVQDIQAALAELRRVASEDVVVVVPKERPYRYSFNPHLHFFPYPWSWQAVAGVRPGATLQDLGDWFYVEPVTAAGTSPAGGSRS
ncbi:class I SAM-dependent methyltransferase [Oryzobacter sp. R7]|uniref:class I SAM-dependent methyltransferase n=1 Tax=Oryzobacter faecalis TaxID=3388656 RepID=UPI00398CC743